MQIVTERELRRAIAGWWALEAAETVDRCWPTGAYNPHIIIAQADRLKAIGPEPTLDQIAEVIGRSDAEIFCTITCTECDEIVSLAVEIEGDCRLYEDIFICLDCLQEAVRLLQSATG